VVPNRARLVDGVHSRSPQACRERLIVEGPHDLIGEMGSTSVANAQLIVRTDLAMKCRCCPLWSSNRTSRASPCNRTVALQSEQATNVPVRVGSHTNRKVVPRGRYCMQVPFMNLASGRAITLGQIVHFLRQTAHCGLRGGEYARLVATLSANLNLQYLAS
jgi:hypothetical protein